VEHTVGTWILEGTSVSERSKIAYRQRASLVPRYLEAAGFRPPPTAPTQFRREHVDALKYRAIGVGGAARGRPLAPKHVGVLLSALHDLLRFWGDRLESKDLLRLVGDRRLWRYRDPQPVRRSRSLETLADLERLVACCDLRTRVGVMLGADAGLRVAEIVALEVRDMELAVDRASWVTVRSGKGAKPRLAPVSPAARNVLLEATHGLPGTARVYGLGDAAFREHLRAAGQRAGLGHVHPHRLRATFITFALRGGADLQVVRQWAGHESGDTTADYAHRDPVIEARALQRRDAYLAGGAD
jgi:integrase